MSEKPLSGKRVLIVEDQYLIADDMRRAVLALGGEPLGPFPNVAGAMAAIEPLPDLSLLDINLAGDDVYPLADRLMANNASIVFATGYDETMIPERYTGCGRLLKPVSRANLEAAVAGLF